MTHFLGIDIGTFESKGVIIASDGAVIASAVAAHKMIVPRPGWAEHRAEEDWWGDFAVLSRRLMAESRVDPRDIAAVACSAIGPCMLPVGASGEPLMNAVLYGVDTRATAEIEELTETLGASAIMGRGGNALTSQSVGPKILWLKHHRPELYARARMFLSATPYLVYRLTGEYAIDHYTAAGFTPLYDVATRDWSRELCRHIAGPERLPRLLWSSEVAGRVTAAAAAASGLAAGTPVICGTVDAAAEAVSVGVIGIGDMMLMYGSTIFVILLTEAPVVDARLWYAPWLFPGLHASMAGLATSGTLTRWFADHFARDLNADEVMPRLAGEAAQSPAGAKGVIVLPYFSGERTPIHDPDAKGCIFGLDLTHVRADVYRGVIEGIGYAVRDIVETYESVGQPPRRLIAVGGGTRNPVWLGAVSDITNYPQLVRRTSSGASYGDAFLAALATGHAALADIETWNATKRTQNPDPAARSVYDRQFAIYKALYGQTRDLMARLSRAT